jgi:hypothetical protein
VSVVTHPGTDERRAQGKSARERVAPSGHAGWAPAAAICHAERVEGAGARRVVLDRLLVWSGSRLRPVKLDDVEAAVLEASRRCNRAEVPLSPWQAVGLGPPSLLEGLRPSSYADSSWRSTSRARLSAGPTSRSSCSSSDMRASGGYSTDRDSALRGRDGRHAVEVTAGCVPPRRTPRAPRAGRRGGS